MRIFMIRRNHYILIAPDGGCYLIDTGFEGTGLHMIIPFLKVYLGITKIRGIILTHSHFNHTGGVPPIIKEFKGNIGGVYSSGIIGSGNGDSYADDPIIAAEIVDLCNQYGIPYTTLKEGDTIIDPAMAIEVWSPLTQYADQENVDYPDFETMLSVRFKCEDGSALFTGDMEKWAMEEILATRTESQADVYAIPHHGDINNINDTILSAIQPKFCLVEMLPSSPQVKTYLNSKGIPCHLLLDGSVEVSMNKGVVTTNTNIPDYIPFAKAPYTIF